VRVVEHHQARPVRGEAQRVRDVVRQRVATCFGVHLTGSGARDQAAQEWGPLGQLGDGGVGRGQRPQHRRPGAQRPHALVAAAPGPLLREAVRPPYQLLGQPGLADAGLAGDQHQPAPAQPCLLQHGLQLGERAVAPDERGRLGRHATESVLRVVS
jgi:hypothetical protein